MFHRLKLNLAWKFLIVFTGLALLVIPITSYLFISQSLKVLQKEGDEKAMILRNNLRDKGISMTRNIALNIASAVAGSDFSFLQNIISSSAASDREIRYGIIVNKAGVALVHSDPLQVFQTLNSAQDILSRETNELKVFNYTLENEEIMEVAIPITLGLERWGTLRIGYTLQYLNDEIRGSIELFKEQRQSLIGTAIIIAAVSALLGSILAAVFSREIVSAVRMIMKVTQQVSLGDFTPRIDIRTGDELETLGNAVNLMTQNLDQLSRERIQKARMESELVTAELVQKKILPKKDPKLATAEFSSYFRSASETGGDWFTYWVKPDNELVDVMIADVTGHGLPAALLTEAAHSCFHTVKAIHPLLHPGDVLKILNGVLIPQLGGQFGMTAFLSQIDLKNHTITYANAGHNMPLLYHLTNDGPPKASALLARGPWLGDSITDEFDEKTMELKPNTLLLWYTDGLLDCLNEREETFGKKRVMQVLSEHAAGSATIIRDSLVDEIMRFTEGRRPPDDITFIVGKFS